MLAPPENGKKPKETNDVKIKTTKKNSLNEDLKQMIAAEQGPKITGTQNIEILRNKLRSMNYNYEMKCAVVRKIKSEGIRDEDNKLPWYIITPTHPGKRVWDVFIYVANFYSLFFLPIDVGITKECCMDIKIADLCATLDIIASILFFTDIFFNFFTAIYDKKGLLIFNIKEIAVSYLYSSFPLDVISSYTFKLKKDSCIVPTSISNSLINFFGIFRLNKFGQLNRMVEKSNTEYINLFRLLKILLFFYFVCHFIGCIIAGVTTLIYKIQEFLITDQKTIQNFFKIYSYCMLLGITSILNSDAEFTTPGEKVLITIINILSMAITANIFGYVALIIENINSSNVTNNRMLREKIDLINEYLLYEDIDERVRLEVNIFYKFMYIRQRMLFDKNMYMDLNSSLYAFSKFELWKESYFKKDTLFRRDEISASFFQGALNVMKGRMYQKDDIIIEEGESSLDFFMVCQKSMCEVYCSGLLINNLVNGNYFGETASFIASKRRTATVISKTDGDYVFIPGKDFFKLILDFEKERNFFLGVAKKYLDTYNKIITPDRFKSFVTKKGKIFQTVIQENLHINPLVQKNKLFYKVEGSQINQNKQVISKNEDEYMKWANKHKKQEKLEIFDEPNDDEL
jgi:hypothetical protein